MNAQERLEDLVADDNYVTQILYDAQTIKDIKLVLDVVANSKVVRNVSGSLNAALMAVERKD